MRQYDIFVKERTVDTLNQQFTLFRQELQLERLGWTIKGDFLALSYQIYDRNGNMICEVDQELFHLTRQYYVNILDESQELLIILVVLAINQYDKDLSASSSAAHHSHSNH